jgi:hypothetical protein
MDIPWVRRPLAERLTELTTELHTQWLAFDRELRAGELAHLNYDEASATLTCRRPKAADDDEQDGFYDQLPFCDVADVLRFVNQEWPVPVGVDAAATALRQADRRREQLAGGHRSAGHEPRQLLDVTYQ